MVTYTQLVRLRHRRSAKVVRPQASAHAVVERFNLDVRVLVRELVVIEGGVVEDRRLGLGYRVAEDEEQLLCWTCVDCSRAVGRRKRRGRSGRKRKISDCLDDDEVIPLRTWYHCVG